MSVRELKTELHERIEALTDEQMLQVYEYVRIHFGGLPAISLPELATDLPLQTKND